MSKNISVELIRRNGGVKGEQEYFGQFDTYGCTENS